jgi:multidrug resistance efflux pump
MAQAQAEMAKAQSSAQTSQLDVKKKELEIAQQQLVNMRAELELMATQEKINTGRAFDPEKMQQFIADTDETLKFLADHVAASLEPQEPEEAPEAEQPEAEEPKEASNPAKSPATEVKIKVSPGEGASMGDE